MSRDKYALDGEGKYPLPLLCNQPVHAQADSQAPVAYCNHDWEVLVGPHKECVHCGDVRIDASPQPAIAPSVEHRGGDAIYQVLSQVHSSSSSWEDVDKTLYDRQHPTQRRVVCKFVQAIPNLYVWFSENNGTERAGEQFIRAWTSDPTKASGLKSAIGKEPVIYYAAPGDTVPVDAGERT